jgi:hypothetical protein
MKKNRVSLQTTQPYAGEKNKHKTLVSQKLLGKVLKSVYKFKCFIKKQKHL